MLALPRFDDAVLERPGLFMRHLEIQVGGIDGVAHHQTQHAVRCCSSRPRGQDGAAGQAQVVSVCAKELSCHVS
jgi:hypothetical protein